GNTNSAFSIGYYTTDGTASNGVNYAGATNTVSFAAGQTNATFSVPVFDDHRLAGDLTVNLYLANPPPSVDFSGQTAAVLVVLDHERRVQFDASNYFVDEGTNAGITLVRAGGISGTVSVMFYTSAGTATPDFGYHDVRTLV